MHAQLVVSLVPMVMLLLPLGVMIKIQVDRHRLRSLVATRSHLRIVWRAEDAISRGQPPSMGVARR